MDLFEKGFLAWLAFGLLFWTVYSVFVKPDFTWSYYLFVVIIGGYILWRNGGRIASSIASWRAVPFVKFAAIGYGMVLLEEFFAALANVLRDGFTVPMLFTRVLQHWVFNIFTFTGFIVGWYLLLTRLRYSDREAFFLSGAFGLISEGVVAKLLSNPLALFVWTPVVIAVYGVILWPSVLSVQNRGSSELHWLARYPLSFIVPFICSLLPVWALYLLGQQYPVIFPPYLAPPK